MLEVRQIVTEIPSEEAPAPAPRLLIPFLAGILLTLFVGPLITFAAFTAHEPHCEDSEAFWNGDLPAGEGPVEGVVLGSSRMGMNLDVFALAEATGHAWVRVARHAVEQASIPRSYPRLLASTPASPGMKYLVIEASPLMFDDVGCARPELEGVPMRAHWMPAAWDMLGDEAELASAVAMGWLPHRWLMTSGRRHDIVEHVKRPAHSLQLLRDLPGVLAGRRPPARWEGEYVPDLSEERVMRRREFLFGAPLDRYVPEVNESCMALLAEVVAVSAAERTVLVVPPLRERMRDTLPPEFRAAFLAAVHQVAARAPVPTQVLDATDRFAGAEEGHFTDFDHLDANGAAVLTAEIVAALQTGH